MRTLIRVAAAVLSVFAATSAQGVPRYDVIDMHFHAELPDAEGPPGGKICAPYTSWSPRDPGQPIDKYLDWFTINPACKHVLVAPVDAAELRDRSVAVLRRYNALALAGGSADIVEDYRAHAAGRILPSAGFGSDGKFPAIAELRQLYKDGKLTALSEITTQYAGIAPDDPRLEPYFALAEQLDIPVGIHMGPGPPGTAYFSTPGYRVAAGDPLRLEPVLLRHPRLRIYAMHAGWPMGESMIAVMFAHPQLYVDIAVLDFAYPEPSFYKYLKELIDAGMEERIMFGSDNMVWPDAIGVAIDRIKRAPFLSDRQKRLILHDNAARFLRIEG